MSDPRRAPADDISMTPDAREPAVWQRIAATIAREIDAKGEPAGTRLPTEAAFARRFEVNRHTVRRALDWLVRTGQVRVEQGKGAFVADAVLDYAVAPRTRFSETIRRQNRHPEGQVLRLRESEASPAAAAGLGIAAGAPVVWLERLGLADGLPVSLADHYFCRTRFPGLFEALRATRTVTAALQAVGVDDYVRQSTRVAARLPTAAEADLLQVPPTQPLLVCENINVDRDGRPIEFALTRHPSARVHLVFEP